MLRGLISGLFWGAVVSALGLASISLITGPNARRAVAPDPVDVAVPAGSEFNRGRPEAPPVIPGSEGTAETSNAPLVTEGQTEPVPLADTASADVPQSDSQAPVVAGAPETESETLALSVGDADGETVETPVIVVPGAEEETVPDAPEMPVLTLDAQDGTENEPEQPEPEENVVQSPVIQLPGAEDSGDAAVDPLVIVVEEEPAQNASIEETGGLVLTLPDSEETSSEPEEVAAAPESEEVEAKEPIDTSWMRDTSAEEVEDTTPEPTPAPEGGLSLVLPGNDEGAEAEAPEAAAEPVETVTQAPVEVEEKEEPTGLSFVTPDTDSTAPAPGSDLGVTIKLPTIGVADDPEPETLVIADEPEQDEITLVLPGDEGISLGALARNSIPYTKPDDTPLVGIVLIDVGEEGLDREGLMTFSFPVAIAIDPTNSDALEAAKAYRDAGLEVLVQAPPIPEGIDPRDAGDVLTAYVDAVPQAIGLVDAAQGGFQSNRRMVGSAIEALMAGGHGLLTYDRGLNTALQMAQREGLPAGAIFRTLDAEREGPDTIKRYLDRAAFLANQDGQVIMIGHSYPETVTAIFTWVMDNIGQDIMIAPVSAPDPKLIISQPKK